MDEIHEVVTKCYKDFEKKMKSECKKRKWKLDYSNGKINSINGKDGRFFIYNFQRDYIEELHDGTWKMRLDFGFMECHYAPRNDDSDMIYEAKLEGAFMNNKGDEYPFSFEGEFFSAHGCGGDYEDSVWSFVMENEDKMPPFWDEVSELLHDYIVSEM